VITIIDEVMFTLFDGAPMILNVRLLTGLAAVRGVDEVFDQDVVESLLVSSNRSG
jgi:hypothetical protein